MNARRFVATLRYLAATCALATALHAQNVTTDPVGAITITLKGSGDTIVSLPFHRPVALETQVLGVSGNTISINATLANIGANQFVHGATFNSTTVTDTYYLQFLSGNREGMYYTVTANDQSSFTVNPNGDTLSGNIAVNDTFRIIPYWTLNTLFPNGQGVNGTSSVSPSQRNSELLFPPNNTPGSNLVASVIYYYYNGTAGGGAGWRLAGDVNFTIQNNAIVYPDSFFVVRNLIPGNTSLTIVGNVPMSAYSTPISTLQANTDQDIFVGINAPVPVTLAQTNLFQSGVFLGTSSLSPSQRQDTLLVYNSTLTGFNNVPAQIYYYYTGPAGGGPGWRLAGDTSFTNIYDNVAIMQPGQGYIIRKKATAQPQSFIWSFVPSYLSP